MYEFEGKKVVALSSFPEEDRICYFRKDLLSRCNDSMAVYTFPSRNIEIINNKLIKFVFHGGTTMGQNFRTERDAFTDVRGDNISFSIFNEIYQNAIKKDAEE